MVAEAFRWLSASEFVDREGELAELERWWQDPDRTPMSLYGRRRCGKSWLLRRFAHGKPAVVLVARRIAPGAQLDDFADRLEPLLGVRPALNSLADLFRTLYRAGRDQKLLVVIDEFPYLLPVTEADTDRELTAIAAVMEDERDTSALKLVLCGSLVAQMESLLPERGPLHGRLRPFQLHPVGLKEARLFMPGLTDPIIAFERFAITGGMPRYLTVLGDPRPVADVVCERLLNPNAALWDEGKSLLQELREPKVYFAILEALASGDKDSAEIVTALRSDAQRVSKYLRVLEEMRLVDRRLPAGAEPSSRSGHWHLRDPFLRFWFRFVFPFQDDLESGLPASTLYDTEVAPALNDHVGPQFEEHCRRWTRATQKVTRVDAWWGHALHALRRTGVRSSEEIGIVGTARAKVAVIGEARWRNSAMDVGYLFEIESYKLPALRQSGTRVVPTPRILFFSRGGYTDALRTAADGRDDVTLVDVPDALSS
jgi:uncharacterized protein